MKILNESNILHQLTPCSRVLLEKW